MSPEIAHEAKVTVQKTAIDSLTAGDVLAYFIAGHLFVHRITTLEAGTITLQADKPEVAPHAIEEQAILGKVIHIKNPHWVKRITRKVHNYARRNTRRKHTKKQ